MWILRQIRTSFYRRRPDIQFSTMASNGAQKGEQVGFIGLGKYAVFA
jgi:hypothetical protein